jgi:hypothetical protein
MWHWRIAMQLEADEVGKTYAVYAGVLEEGERHSTYEPQESGGRGEPIPDCRKEKVRYSQAHKTFPYVVEALNADGYRYRD